MAEKAKVKFEKNIIFYTACAENDVNEVKKQIMSGVDVNYQNPEGLTVLHIACIQGKIELCAFLIKNGANIDSKDNEGWTPLHAAASMNNFEHVKFLVKKGASLSIINYDLKFPFELTTDQEIIDFLEDKMMDAGVNKDLVKNNEHFLMMQHAHYDSFYDFVDPQTGVSALHVAAAKNYIDVLKIILERKVDVNQTDFDDWTPLHAAAYFGSQEACELLIKAGASTSALTKLGQTPGDLATSRLRYFINALSNQISRTDRMGDCNLDDSTSDLVKVMSIKKESEPSLLKNEHKSETEHTLKDFENISFEEIVKPVEDLAVDSAKSGKFFQNLEESQEERSDETAKRATKQGGVDSEDTSKSHELSIAETKPQSSDTPLDQNSYTSSESPKKKSKKGSKVSSRRATGRVESKDIDTLDGSISILSEIVNNENQPDMQECSDLLSKIKCRSIPLSNNSIPYRIRNCDRTEDKDSFCSNCFKVYADLMLIRIENSKLRRKIDCINLRNFIIMNYDTFSKEAIKNIKDSLETICQLEENKVRNVYKS